MVRAAWRTRRRSDHPRGRRWRARIAVREMSITMRRAAMSPVLAIGNDFSNCVADGHSPDGDPGQDQPVHLGAMIFAVKEVAAYFAGISRRGTPSITTIPAQAAAISRT